MPLVLRYCLLLFGSREGIKQGREALAMQKVRFDAEVISEYHYNNVRRNWMQDCRAARRARSVRH
ncbi:MAG: hypothetical protein H7346_27705 [Burkholderiaceae bacterium]|nr:hypothetical protein [Burkholderiaceae bacterium]